MKRNGVEELQANGQEPLGVCVGRNGRKIEQSISYMLQHLNQPLHVATLAAAVSVSPSHYSALFKRWTGCSPIDYFIHLRMQLACRLFDRTSLNVKEVAAALGYDDPFYFSRIFKSVNRLAPSEYRMMPEKIKDDVRRTILPKALSWPESHDANQATLGRSLPGNGRARADSKGTPPLLRVFESSERTNKIGVVSRNHEEHRILHSRRKNFC
ncbi:MAG TPA: AraC family transcriptional regulator [Verrucomicrobiae bacterium]|nr:AraC family transcriptional regulator [Verrucomicrobiae bacterium]